MYTIIWIILNLILIFGCDVSPRDPIFWGIQALFTVGAFTIPKR